MGADEPSVPEWVTQRTVPGTTAAEIRRAVCEDLIAAARTTCGFYHGVAIIDGAACMADGTGYGKNAALLDHLAAYNHRPFSEWADVGVDVLTTFNSFIETTDDQIRDNKIYRLCWVPMKCKSVLAMSAVVGSEFVGWIGVHRIEGEEYFGDELVSKVQRRAGAYVHALEVAHRLDGHAHDTRAIIVLTAGGETTCSCSQGEAWMANEQLATSLRQLVRAAAGGEEVSARVMHGALVRVTRVADGAETLYCAEVSRAETWTPPRVAALSARKRQIAQLAAFGATNAEIARSLDLSVDTVRSYLRQVFDELEISSRVELANRVYEFVASASTA